MKTSYLLLIVVVIGMVSCRAKKGDPGPGGTAGANGTTGGNALTKQGSIAGTLSYVDYKDSALSIPFNYQYFESISEGTYYLAQGFYTINISRKDITDVEKSFTFSLNGRPMNNGGSFGTPAYPAYGSFNFSYLTTINKNLFEFSGYDHSYEQVPVHFGPQSSSTCTVSNFALDTISGRVTFQYAITYSPDDIYQAVRYDSNTPATITGNVDVILNKINTLPSLP